MDFYLAAILQGLCFSALALGIFLSMKIFKIPDITTDGTFTMGGSITAVLLLNNTPLFLAFPLVVAAGAAAGALTGLIHTKLRIHPLLAGILVMTGLYSLNLLIMGRSNIPLVDKATIFNAILQPTNENSLIILLLIVLFLVLKFGYLLKTDFGLAMRATGNSETMIRALGVNTDKMKTIGLALANSLTATSGFMITQLQGFSDINMGIGVVIIGLGSVIIGETFINFFGIKSIWNILILVISGAVLFQIVLAFTLSMGIDANLLKLVTALFVLLIVSLPRLLRFGSMPHT